MRVRRCAVLVAAVALGVADATPATAAPWRFIAVGDSRGDGSGVNVPVLTGLAAQVVIEQPAVVLFPGDLVYGSADPELQRADLVTWRNIMQPVYDAGVRVLVVRGNHDDYGPAGAWNDVFSGPYGLPDNGPPEELNLTYSLRHENALFIGLDEYSGHEHRVNQAWLDAELGQAAWPHVFAFGHEPAFRAGHEDCLDSFPAERDVFWASLARARGRVHFCGHDHFYDHARIDDGDGNADNDLHQVVVGTGGAPLAEFDGIYNGDNGAMIPQQQYYASRNGYVVVDVDGRCVTLTWKELDDNGAYTAAEAWSYEVVAARGDLDGDGYITGADFVALAGCSAGPDIELPSTCAAADLDADGDADLADFGLLQRDFTGGM